MSSSTVAPMIRTETDLCLATVQRLEDMSQGWFMGDFSPAALRTTSAEVAVKHVAAGTVGPPHLQRLATEVTVVVSGTVVIGGHHLVEGDVLVIPPGIAADFRALTDSVLVIAKTPSAPGDKSECTAVQL